MTQNDNNSSFTLKEVVEIFQTEVEQITDNSNEASNYATSALQDFQNIYQWRIR